MAKNKTEYTSANVNTFIEELDSESKRQDSYRLIELMALVSGEQPRMFGPTIIGFGKYRYEYPSGHRGEAPILGFSPRKAAISLYVNTGCEDQSSLLERLGKYKKAVACIYIKKLSDIHIDILVELMKSTIAIISKKYERLPD